MQELAALAVHMPQDSVVPGPPPLPGGVAAFIRFLFEVPQPIQIGGAIAGVLLALLLVVVLWQRRAAVFAWWRARPRAFKIGVFAAVGLLVVSGAAGGAVSWNYMQHDNEFCTGCHVMGAAYLRFTVSEHDSLSCHNCHEQSIFASTRQLYLWVVDRPVKIGEHAPVPNDICERCHVTGKQETWQHVASTAGHRVHLESDSSALAGVMCVTCHGQEVHHFLPVDSTCARAGCHVNTRIALGPMKDQTSLHCITCHQFTADVPLIATRDSASGTLVPSMKQCLTCHEMRKVIDQFDPVRDPHHGTCGDCHHPHEQQRAVEAAKTCVTAGCHDQWRAEPFHTGTHHLRVGSQCILCHQPHAAQVDASDCTACHQRIVDNPDAPPEVRRRLRGALPFDTTAALRRGAEGG